MHRHNYCTPVRPRAKSSLGQTSKRRVRRVTRIPDTSHLRHSLSLVRRRPPQRLLLGELLRHIHWLGKWSRCLSPHGVRQSPHRSQALHWNGHIERFRANGDNWQTKERPRSGRGGYDRKHGCCPSLGKEDVRPKIRRPRGRDPRAWTPLIGAVGQRRRREKAATGGGGRKQIGLLQFPPRCEEACWEEGRRQRIQKISGRRIIFDQQQERLQLAAAKGTRFGHFWDGNRHKTQNRNDKEVSYI